MLFLNKLQVGFKKERRKNGSNNVGGQDGKRYTEQRYKLEQRRHPWSGQCHSCPVNTGRRRWSTANEEIPLSLWHPSRVFDRASSPLPGGQICGLQPFLLVELVPHGSPHRSWIKPPTSSVATAPVEMRRLPLGIYPSAQRSRRADRSEHCVTFCGEPWSADLHYGSMGSLGLHSQSLVGECQLSREGWRSV